MGIAKRIASGHPKQKTPTASFVLTGPERNGIITVLSDKNYMEDLYRKFCFLKEMIKLEK